jgi:hypothetical protein
MGRARTGACWRDKLSPFVLPIRKSIIIPGSVEKDLETLPSRVYTERHRGRSTTSVPKTMRTKREKHQNAFTYRFSIFTEEFTTDTPEMIATWTSSQRCIRPPTWWPFDKLLSNSMRLLPFPPHLLMSRHSASELILPHQTKKEDNKAHLV